MRTVYYIKEALQIPGCWGEFRLDKDTGIWEFTGQQYYVTDNGVIIDAADGRRYDEDDFDDIVWHLMYTKKPSLGY